MIKFYELSKVEYDPEEPYIATAAILNCSLCGTVIAGMGGPGSGVLCENCGNRLLSGKSLPPSPSALESASKSLFSYFNLEGKAIVSISEVDNTIIVYLVGDQSIHGLPNDWEGFNVIWYVIHSWPKAN